MKNNEIICNTLAEYMALREKGYICLWSGECKLCMIKKYKKGKTFKRITQK